MVKIGFLDTAPFSEEQIRAKFNLPWMGVEVVNWQTPSRDVLRTIQQYKLQLVHANKTPVGADSMDAISVNNGIGCVSDATGYDQFDWKYASTLKVPVINVVGYATVAVAESTLWHVINLARGYSQISAAITLGDYFGQESPFYYDYNLSQRNGHHLKLHPPIEIRGRTIGLIGGAGRIGNNVALRCSALGMDVLVYDLYLRNQAFKNVDLDTLLAESDFVSLHLPAGDKPIITAREIALMKQSAGLINTSRKVLVDEAAVQTAILEGKLRGYGRDVYAPEPPPKGQLLVGIAVDTGHNSFRTEESLEALLDGMFKATVALYERDYSKIINPWDK